MSESREVADLKIPRSARLLCLCRRFLKDSDVTVCSSCGRVWQRQKGTTFEVVDRA